MYNNFDDLCYSLNMNILEYIYTHTLKNTEVQCIKRNAHVGYRQILIYRYMHEKMYMYEKTVKNEYI